MMKCKQNGEKKETLIKFSEEEKALIKDELSSKNCREEWESDLSLNVIRNPQAIRHKKYSPL